MKKNLTEIVCIIDNSGSMGMIKDAAIEGFNNFIKKQKELAGEAVVSVILFNEEHSYVAKRENINEVALLTRETYITNGSTALNDTLGTVINDVAQNIVSMKRKDQPSKVLFCIVTDGEENASKEFSEKQVRHLVEYRKEMFKWDFMFMGANQDVKKTAKAYSFDEKSTFAFKATSMGVLRACEDMNAYTTLYRQS